MRLLLRVSLLEPDKDRGLTNTYQTVGDDNVLARPKRGGSSGHPDLTAPEGT